MTKMEDIDVKGIVKMSRFALKSQVSFLGDLTTRASVHHFLDVSSASHYTLQSWAP